MTSQAGPNEPAPLIIEDLRKSYPSPEGDLVVLAGIDLVMNPGESLAITGPSGSGKSTLLHIVGGLDSPTSGQISLAGISVASLSPAEKASYRNRSVGFVFQDHHLLSQCTILENVLLPTLPAGSASTESIDRARSLIDRVGLSSRIGHRPAELSGGERQRVAIARALINHPRLLLCDEPTGNLDRANAQRMGELLLDLARESSAILMVVTHSPELAQSLPKQCELRDGLLIPTNNDKLRGSS
jgi:lipoprotein-releasing system ATP-binding protein